MRYGYIFNNHESIPDEVRRIALEQVDKAHEQTKLEFKNRDEVIHDVRVPCKEVRALLRLARAKNNDHAFKNENVCFRNTGRHLLEVRDTIAMIEAFDRLTKRYANQLAPNAFAELRKPFLRARRKQQSGKNEAVMDVARMLESARSRVAD
jgi:nucleoid-associated protein YejK